MSDYHIAGFQMDPEFQKKLLLKSLPPDDPDPYRPETKYIKDIAILEGGLNLSIYTERHDPLFPDWPVCRKFWTWSEILELQKSPGRIK